MPFSLAYSLSYDGSGNLISDDEYYYEYDGFDNLITVREGDSSGRIVEEYVYDDTGMRLKKISYYSDGTNSTSYYVGEDYVHIINSSGSYNVTYYYDGVILLGKKINDDLYYIEADHLGSTGVITDENGIITSEYAYEPYGASVGGFNERTYTGKELDDTGLHYYGARYYNSELAKFTQPDPVIKDIYNPQNLNRYAYVLNNPYKYTDPDGRVAFLAPLVYVAAITMPVWAPAMVNLMAYDATLAIEQAQKDPSPINVAMAGLALGDAVTPGIPEGKIVREAFDVAPDAANAFRRVFGSADEVSDVGRITDNSISSPTSSSVPSSSGFDRSLLTDSSVGKFSRQLPDGRIRTYDNFRPARTPGEMVGARMVRESTPSGRTADRMWNEVYDSSANTRIAAPRSTRQHYGFDKDGGHIKEWE